MHTHAHMTHQYLIHPQQFYVMAIIAAQGRQSLQRQLDTFIAMAHTLATKQPKFNIRTVHIHVIFIVMDYLHVHQWLIYTTTMGGCTATVNYLAVSQQ